MATDHRIQEKTMAEPELLDGFNEQLNREANYSPSR